MDGSEYCARRSRRRELAGGALADAVARRTLLASWRLPDEGDVVERVAGEVRLPAGPEADRLVAWALGPLPALAPHASELEFDRAVIAAGAGTPASVEQREIAAWYLLARLGEEVARHDDARQLFHPHPQDAATRAVFVDLFAGRFRSSTGRTLRGLFGGGVKRAFAAVGVHLRLPPAVMDAKLGEALESLEFLAYQGGWADVAIRMVEGTGEPVAALAQALDPVAADLVGDCVARRESWGATARALHGGLPTPVALGGALAAGARAHAFLRVVGGLSARVPSASALGLPGWLVVTQNRGKIRGRLRAVLARDPTRLATAVLSLDALHARAQAAFARFAWDWAWREAHAGFSFGGAALQAPTCELPESPSTAAPAGPLDPAAVTNAVLLLVARGVAEDLSRWVSGEPSALLSAKFYRYLAKVPDAVADPGTRGRSYLRLREHLEDTLADYFAAIAVVARRVVSIPVSARGMVDALAGALAPEWDPALVPFPSSGSQAIRAALKDFLESELLSGGSGETP